ncbi:MAG TPA: hypothetical protein VF932_00660 [Anaerolineae bacterium]
MAYSQDQLQSLLKQAEDLERSARKRAIIYTVIPIIAAGVFVLFTGWQIQQANQQLQTINGHLNESQQALSSVNTQLGQTKDELNRAQQDLAASKQEAARYRDQAAVLQKQLNDLNEQLRQSSTFKTFLCPFNLSVQEKGTLSRYPQQQGFWQDVLGSMSFKWNLGGSSPAEGFDSPSFAAYILGRNGKLPGPATEARYRLQQLLPPRDRPQVGDVVFYQYGYTMFYITDLNNRACVVGMTPQGVLSLKLDFAPVTGYGKVF